MTMDLDQLQWRIWRWFCPSFGWTATSVWFIRVDRPVHGWFHMKYTKYTYPVDMTASSSTRWMRCACKTISWVTCLHCWSYVMWRGCCPTWWHFWYHLMRRRLKTPALSILRSNRSPVLPNGEVKAKPKGDGGISWIQKSRSVVLLRLCAWPVGLTSDVLYIRQTSDDEVLLTCNFIVKCDRSNYSCILSSLHYGYQVFCIVSYWDNWELSNPHWSPISGYVNTPTSTVVHWRRKTAPRRSTKCPRATSGSYGIIGMKP